MADNLTARRPGGDGSRLPTARARGVRIGLVMALSLLALLVNAGMPAIALAHPVAPLGGCSTNAAAQKPGMCAKANPSYGSSGTSVTVQGSSYIPGDAVVISYSPNSCSSGTTPISGAKSTVGTDGSIKITFQWPQTNPGKYTICVTDTSTNQTSTSPGAFQVLAPAITATAPTSDGGPVTVNGSGFYPSSQPNGSSVEVLYGPPGSNGCATSVGTTTVDNSGNFSITFNSPHETAAAQIPVTAVEPQATCGNSPNLQASTTLALPGPTVTPTTQPTAAPTTTPSGGGPPVLFTWPPTGALAVLYCLVGLLILLLLLLLLRRRRKDEPVTIEEQDRVVVTGGSTGAGGAAGTAQVQRQIVARDAQGNVTPIAEEVYNTNEELVDPNDPNAGQGR
jgi:hypothetical protein